MIKNIILLGPPGVGKGTLAKFLEENNNMFHLSTGDVFRNEIANKTELGIKVKKILHQGEYVSDQITNQIIKNILTNKTIQKDGFVLDGYPRTINQSAFLEKINFPIFKVVYLSLTKDKIMERLLKRNRKDDNKKTIENRLKIYLEQTQPLIDHYKKQNLLLKIDASGTPKENYDLFLKEVFNGNG